MFTKYVNLSTILNTAGVPKSTWYDNLNKTSSLDKMANNKGRPITQDSKKKNGTLVSNSDIISILESYRREYILHHMVLDFRELCANGVDGVVIF